MKDRQLRRRFRWHPERALWSLVVVAIALVILSFVLVAATVLAMVLLGVGILMLVGVAVFAWRVRRTPRGDTVTRDARRRGDES